MAGLLPVSVVVVGTESRALVVVVAGDVVVEAGDVSTVVEAGDVSTVVEAGDVSTVVDTTGIVVVVVSACVLTGV